MVIEYIWLPILPYIYIVNKISTQTAQNRREQSATGGGTATLQVLSSAEELAASTLFPEAIEGFGGVEVGGYPGN